MSHRTDWDLFDHHGHEDEAGLFAAVVDEWLGLEGAVIIRKVDGEWPGWVYGFQPSPSYTLVNKLDALMLVETNGDL